MAINWIQNQRNKVTTYAINVDSKSAILAIANKHTTHPIAVDSWRKLIELRKDISVKIHWVKGHSVLQGNEKADYMAKIVASYNPNITYDEIPMSRGKRILEDYYTAIWNATYTNSEKGPHTKTLIPSIFHRKTQTLWPNYVLTQFLTNHGCFRSYLYKRTKASSPLCSCPEMEEQTALHLLKDCSLFSKVRPAVFQTLTLPQVMQHHINTKEVSSLINNIYSMLQQQSLSDQL